MGWNVYSFEGLFYPFLRKLRQVVSVEEENLAGNVHGAKHSAK